MIDIVYIFIDGDAVDQMEDVGDSEDRAIMTVILLGTSSKVSLLENLLRIVL